MRNMLFSQQASRISPLARFAVIFLILALLITVPFDSVMAMFTNGDFESGVLDNWTTSQFYNPGLSCTSGGSCIVRNSGGANKTKVVGGPAVDPMSLSDSRSTIKYPRFGHYSAVVNELGSSNNANSLKQTTTVTSSDIDPADGKVHVRFAYAPVLENPGHSPAEQPYFYIALKNITKGGMMLYDKFAFSGQAGVPWQGTSVLYTDWQMVDIAPGAGNLDVGDTIELEVIAAGCSQSGHYGYVYVDAFGAFLPGLSISASGPATISRGQDITYSYQWANTGNTTINNVVITSVVPENTTYVSNNAGCSFGSGTVTCNLGTKNPHDSGVISITYNVGMGAVGSINHGNYSIAGSGFAPIIGPLVTTTVNPDTPPTSFTSSAPAGARYGASYNHDFNANGVPAPTYQIVSGSLPPGLVLESSTGVLSGIPNAAGTYTFAVRAVNSAGSLTQAYTITVAKVNTLTTVTPSAASPVYGQPFFLNANVSPSPSGVFTPAGPVQFFVDGEQFGGPVMLSGGTAVSQTTTSLSAGDHVYYAEYLGNANHNASVSTPAKTIRIEQNSTTVVVSSSAPTSVYGQPVQLTAVVDEELPSIVTPVGQVQFYVDDLALGAPVNLDGTGKATTADLHTLLPAGHLLVGEHTFSAAYLGNSNTLPSNTGTSTQTINKVLTTLSISSSENPTVYGTSLEMTINVTADHPSIAVPAGEVQLLVDGVPFGTILKLDGSGKARRTVPYLNLWPGSHAVTAVYTPDAPEQFIGSNNNAQPLNQVVNKANPVFIITPSDETLVASQTVSYSVVVGPSMVTQGTPTGTVQFIVDGILSGDPVTLDKQGKANIPLSINLQAGEHTIAVSYSGDDYFLTVPTSPEFNQTVQKANVSTRIVSIDPAESVVGQPVTVVVQVDQIAPATGVPDGTVLVSNGIVTCQATSNALGSGSCVLEPTSPGSPALIAAYSGSANFNGSTSEPFAGPDVSKADSAAVITGFEPQAPVTGQPVTVTFAVEPVAPGFGTPTGDVTIADQQGRACTAPITAGSCQITFDEAGPTGLTASYAGDSNFNSSESMEVAGPVVAKAHTGAALLSLTPLSVYGQPVHFTAVVYAIEPGAGEPTGQVQFMIDGANFGDPVELVNQVADSQDIADLSVAGHTVSAVYLGDANFMASSTPTMNQVVNKANTILNLTSNLNPSPYGMSVLVTAALTGADPSQAIPTSGTVQFTVDGVKYGAPVAVGTDGKASKLLPYTALWVGSHTITATYSGNESFNGSIQFEPLTQVVEKGSLVITLDPTVEAPVFGQAVGLVTTVDGEGANNPVPSGTVQFVVDGTNLGDPVSLDDQASAASALISNLAVGPHDLRLIYSGDDYYTATTLNIPSGLVISKAAVDTSVTGFDPADVVVGQPVRISFAAAAADPGAGTPTGTVTISSGGDSCTASVSDGFCDLIPTAAGSLKLSLMYSGDENFNTLNLPDALDGPTVSPAGVMVTITDITPETVVVGQPYTVTARMTPVDPGTLIPVGAIVTLSNGTVSCTAAVQEDGSAACSLTPSAAGRPDLTAGYEGGANFNASTSEPVQGPAVGPAGTTTALVTSINPVVEGNSVKFAAAVLTISPGSGTPQGQVQFMIDGEKLGGPVNLVKGKAFSPDVTDLPLGAHTVRAVYLGSANYTASSSPALTQKAVPGDLGRVITPEEDDTLVFDTTQNGMPVRTEIYIPAGAVPEDVTIVFNQFNDSALTPPEGQDFVASFTVDVYINGILQPDFIFLKPVTFTMGYNPKNWKESDMVVLGWDGSQWSGDGITMTGQDSSSHSINFTLNQTGQIEFALVSTPEYLFWFPIIGQQ